MPRIGLRARKWGTVAVDVHLTCMNPDCKVPFHDIRLDSLQGFLKLLLHSELVVVRKMIPSTRLHLQGGLWPTFNERTSDGHNVVVTCVNKYALASGTG